MANERKPLNEGYQPVSNSEQRGYQPKPNGNFGYQPANNVTKAPTPPKSGSNAVKSEK